MQSEVLQDFHLKILTLAPGQYTYTLPITNTFFSAFEHSLVQKGALEAVVHLDKADTLMRVLFDISGTIELESDRSLELFNHPVSVHRQLIYKYGDTDAELSEEMFQIKWETPTLDVAQPIYEFITLAVPMRKLKPGEEHEPEGTIADDERRLVYRSETEPDEETEPDPTWDALRKLFPN
jgi:uncharacterized metal-binding protein YceD (DUF177 family)